MMTTRAERESTDAEKIHCACGWFARKPYPVIGGGLDLHISDVLNDCRRCGDGAPTMLGWWHSWDAWLLDEWPETPAPPVDAAPGGGGVPTGA